MNEEWTLMFSKCVPEKANSLNLNKSNKSWVAVGQGSVVSK